MRKLILFLLLSVITIGANAQDIVGDSLILYKGASIDGKLDLNGNKAVNVLDPTDPQDAVTLQYFNNNTPSGDNPYIDFEVNTLDPAYKQARLWYDSLRAEMVFYDRVVDMKFGTVGEISIRVLNNSGGTITMGEAVYPTGASGGFTTIDLAQANTYDTSRPVGFAKNTMLNGEEGWVMLRGILEGVNTSLLSGGVIYLSPTAAGDVTNTIPNNGNFIVRMGAVGVIDALNGVINVDVFTSEHTAESISPRGWPDPTNTLIVPISGTRTAAVIPASGSEFYYYQDGTKYISDGDTLVWDDTEGTIDFYYVDGELTAAYNQTESQVRDIYTNYPGVSRVYWDATNDTIIFANDMRHTFDMNAQTWSAFWDYHKCEVLEGITLTDIVIGNGSLDVHAQFGNEAGLIRNQDILTSIPSQTSTTGYTVFYREGVSAWRSQDGAPFPIITTGTGRAAWNQDIAGTWQLTEATNLDFVLYHLFVSNTLGDKLGLVVGQQEYATISEAQDGALQEINTLLAGQFPIKELAPVATIIFQTAGSYGNAVMSRIVQAVDVLGNPIDYVDWRFANITGGGGGGGGTSTSFLGLTDTPATFSGDAGKAYIVNSGENGLESAEVAKTINGQSPIAGNYNITSTANKVGEDVTIGTGGTGVDAVFSVADNDSDPTNEYQDLSNSKLNNNITIDITNGIGTTITNIARIDFLNPQINSSAYQIGGTTVIDASRNVVSAGSGAFGGNVDITPPIAQGYAQLNMTGDQVGDVAWGIFSGFPAAGDFTIRQAGANNVIIARKTTGAVELNFAGNKKFETMSDGSKTTGNHVVTGVATASNFISNVAIGTQPYSTTSTTLNSNLNSDLLDDQQGVYYLDYNNFSNKPNLGLYALLTGATFSGAVSATSFSGAGSSLTSLNASNISSGTLSDARLSANVAFTNGAEVFSSTVTASNFISNVTTGTQPYSTTSTTLNNNLNADLLDSQEGSYYLALENGTGTLSDARLSSNVALKNIDNDFSVLQTATSLNVESTNPRVTWVGTDQTGQGKYWKVDINTKQFELLYDDESTFTGQSHAIDAAPQAGVTLYYNNLSRIVTTSPGATINGDLIVGDINADDIDCATVDATGNITALDVSTTSDIRLKENMKPILDLKKIDDIKFYQFNMIGDGRQRYGVGAQYIEKNHPEFVHVADDEMKSRSVNYIDLLVVKVARLEQRIDELEESKENENIPYIPLSIIFVVGFIFVQLIKKAK